MLFEATLICGIVGAIGYFMPYRIYKSLLYQIQYFYIGMIYCIDDIRNAGCNKTELPSLSNKVAIVTGGARGIGAEVVKKLLQCNMEVIIACRSTEAGENFIQTIKNSHDVKRVKVYELDNASLASVRSFADRIKKDYNKIHILINNAGVMFPPEYNETKDGFEKQWAVNYLSHFLLSSLLLPLLVNAGSPDDHSRIINVTSCAQDVSIIDFDFIRNNSKESFFTQASYGQSKLAQTMFTITLQELLDLNAIPVRIYSVHPGIVRTDLFKDTFINQHKWLMLFWKTPEKGATPIVYTAVSKELEKKGGICISNCKELSIPSQALVKETQTELFELSLKQVQLRKFFEYL